MIAAALLLFPGVRKMHGLGGAVTGANISLLGMTANFLGGLKLALSQNLQERIRRRIPQSFARDRPASRSKQCASRRSGGWR